jgi:hypothetical protein
MTFRAFGRTAAIVMFVVLGLTSAAAAQGVGIKFGPTFTEFSSDALDYNNRTGIHIGLAFGGNRDGVLGVQSELNFVRKKSEVEGGGPQIRIDYVQIPILLRLNIGSSSASGPSLYGIAGPAFDIKVGDEVEGLTLDRGFEGADITLVFGGGIEIARVILEGRWDKGLRQINNTFSDLIEIKKQTFTVLVGVRVGG